jgi:primosomal protein N' (replication factor Y)
VAGTSYIEVSFPIPLNRTFHYRAEGGSIGSRVLAPFGPKKNLVGFVVGRTAEKPSFPTKEILQWVDERPFIDESLIALARWVSERYLCSLGEALACVAPPALSAPKRRGTSHEGRALVPQPSSLKLTPEQKHALAPVLEAVEAKAYRSFLLRGITDSGKTEVYLRAMDRVLAQGRQALFLLPEIALTPPFLDRLRERYGTHQVGIWHSGLSGGERYRTWTGARNGEIKVLLGARSAVFAPFPKLGLIVLDEEHETTYKQEDRPRYHTREVAIKRAELSSAVLIMGSATPSLESYWNAKRGAYSLLELTSRVEERSLPPVELIDRRPFKGIRDEGRGTSPSSAPIKDKLPSSLVPRPSPLAVFSEPLKFAIEQRLARREQILLFVNRRGFTPFLRCTRCGWVSRCSRCSMTLTLHMRDEEREKSEEAQKPKGMARPSSLPSLRYLQCHACSRREQVPTQCPQCKSMRLHQYGIGTQKVEEELKRLFPFVKAARLDRDIGRQTSGDRRPEKIYRAFAGGELDVLVGTQMIAKGFDFPRVTLVGVVEADASLHLPDFRSAERTFDLLTQVAGRTGRGESKGKVLVQTQHPEHYALVAAEKHDYLGFYERELEDRKRLRYPPFCRLVNIILRATKEPSAHQSSEELFAKLEKLESGADLLGPAPGPYSRLRGQFRYQILIKGTDETLAPCLDFLRSYKPAKAYMSVDVDPADLL